MQLNKEVADIFTNEPCHQLATVSAQGQPNISNIGAKYLLDDGRIVIVDNYMKKTMANLKENPEVAILVRQGKTSYQIKGTAEYLTSGELYEEARAWMKAKNQERPAKGAVIITVHSVYNSMSGADAGEKVQ